MDSYLQVQLMAMPLVGQLCEINPAVGMPMLRGLLLTLRSQLDPPGGGSDPHRSHTRRRHEAVAKLLRLLARHASRLMRTYAQPVLSSLLLQLRATPHASTATELLLTIAELLKTTGRSEPIPWRLSRGPALFGRNATWTLVRSFEAH